MHPCLQQPDFFSEVTSCDALIKTLFCVILNAVALSNSPSPLPPPPPNRKVENKLPIVFRFDTGSCFMRSVTSSNSLAGTRVSPKGPRKEIPNRCLLRPTHLNRSNMPRDLMSTSSATPSELHVCVSVDLGRYNFRRLRSRTASSTEISLLGGCRLLQIPRENFLTS